MSTRRQARDEGSLSLEWVIVAPLFLIVFALIWGFARVGQAHGQLDAATRDAARQVTQLADLSQAATVATQTINQELAGSSCRSPVSVQLDVTSPSGQDLGPAIPQPGDIVTVISDCTYSLADLGVPFGPGDLHATARFSSIVDPNRSTQ
jgi:hypothetical protein